MSGARDGAREPDPEWCSACSGTELTAVALVLTDGTEVTFVSCLRCEHRQWLTPGDDGAWASIPIESVLARSAKPDR